VAALLAGGAVATFAFLLAQVAASVRERRSRATREARVLRAAAEEVASSRATLDKTRKEAEGEIEALSGGHQKLNPLTPVQQKAWTVLVAEVPDPLLADDALLANVREMAHLASEVDEAIRSRENFRLLYPFLDPEYDAAKLERYNNLLGGYDQLIAQKGKRLSRLMEELEPALRSLGASSSPKSLRARVTERRKELPRG